MAKIKVAFDANPLVGPKTGIGQLTQQLILSFAKNNPDIEFIGHYFDFLNRKKPQELPVKSNISYKKTWLFPTKLLSLLRRINIRIPFEIFFRGKADVILFPNFVSMPSLFRSRKVVFVHDLSYIDTPELVSERNGAFLRKWVGRSMKSASLVVTISEFTKKRIEDVYGIGDDKIIVMNVPPKAKAKPDYSLLNEELRDFLLFVGTIEPRKNIVNLLSAYELLDEITQANHPLVIVGGKGWKDEAILDKIDDLKDKNIPVYRVGYVTEEQKSAFYERSVAVIQPSHYEGFGMPIIEAMNYGKPILCSDIAVFHEVAKDAAIFFDKDNPEDIRRAIISLLNNPDIRDSLSAKSKKYTDQYPSWDDVAQQLSQKILI